MCLKKGSDQLKGTIYIYMKAMLLQPDLHMKDILICSSKLWVSICPCQNLIWWICSSQLFGYGYAHDRTPYDRYLICSSQLKGTIYIYMKAMLLQAMGIDMPFQNLIWWICSSQLWVWILTSWRLPESLYNTHFIKPYWNHIFMYKLNVGKPVFAKDFDSTNFKSKSCAP